MRALLPLLKAPKNSIHVGGAALLKELALGAGINWNQPRLCTTAPNDPQLHGELAEKIVPSPISASGMSLNPAPASRGDGVPQPEVELSKLEIGHLCKGLRNQGFSNPKDMLLDFAFNHMWRGNLLILKGLGMSVEEQKQVVLGSHHYASTAPEELQQKISWLETQFGLDAKGVAEVLLKYPLVIEHNLQLNIDPLLSMLRDGGCDQESIKAMVVYCPKMLGAEINELNMLKDIFTGVGFSNSDFLALIQSNPTILRMDSENKVKPFLRGLKELGIEGEDIVKVLSSAPKLIMCDFDQNLLPKLAWFENDLGLEREDVIRKVLLKIPKLFVTNRVGQFKRVVKTLESHGFRIHDYRTVLQEQPQVLGRAFGSKLANINSRLKFLKEVLLRDPKELVAYPSYLSHSFEHHIMYRVAAYDSQGIEYKELSLEQLFSGTPENCPSKKMKDPDGFRAWWVSLGSQAKMDAIKAHSYKPFVQ